MSTYFYSLLFENPTSPLTPCRFRAVEQARSPPPRRMFSAGAVLSLEYVPGHFQSRLLGDEKTGARQKQQERDTPRQWPLDTERLLFVCTRKLLTITSDRSVNPPLDSRMATLFVIAEMLVRFGPQSRR